MESINHRQNIDMCDQLEDELMSMLQKRRQILINALDALHQYRNITAQVAFAHVHVGDQLKTWTVLKPLEMGWIGGPTALEWAQRLESGPYGFKTIQIGTWMVLNCPSVIRWLLTYMYMYM